MGTTEVRSPLIAPDLALERLHLIVPDESDVMHVLRTLAGDGGADPRTLFADRLAEVGHITVSFDDGEPPTVRVVLPDLAMSCVPQEEPGMGPEHLALRLDSIKPSSDHPDGAKVLTVTVHTPIVTAANGVASDTHRLLDWRTASRAAAKAPALYGALKLVDRLEGAERLRASTQRTRFVGAREYWRCKTCRAFWRPDDHQRCASCGREFTALDRRKPEIGKVEFQVPPGDHIALTPDAAVLIEPEDEPNFVGRVSRIDQSRRMVEVVCRSFEHSGSEGWITPSFNRALYQAKRSVLASIATRDFGVGLLAQLLVTPNLVRSSRGHAVVKDGWLTEGMISNPPQDRAVALVSALNPGEAVFIQGPPGTGKTTVIVEAVKRRLIERPEDSILVTSHSNLAVDNALERLAGTPGMRAVRVARAERVHPTVDRFRCDDEDDPRLQEANVFFATCATAATSGITDMNFDLVILDEANKARVDEALPALRLGRSLALVGDHKQLPPVEDDALYGIVESDTQMEELVNRSLFEQCWDGGLLEEARCLLTIQHRMHPQIAAYISKASYEGQLQDAFEVEQYSFITRKPFPVALHFVDTEGMRGVRERRGPGGALRNEAEVRVAAQVVRLLDERTSRDLSIAVIAMYAEQVERLRQALGRRGFKRTLKIDTVDSFEGREEDIVIISLVRSNERGRIGFLRVPNRLNVAISRAKRLVACIGDSATLRAGEESMYGELVEAARQGGGWVSALELVGNTKPRRTARKPRQGEAATAAGSADEATPAQQEGQGARRRRRRRGRRGRSPGAVAPAAGSVAVGSDGEPTEAAAPIGAAAADGEGGQQQRKRRRRRRRRRGGGAAPGVEIATDAGAPPAAAGPAAPVASDLDPGPLRETEAPAPGPRLGGQAPEPTQPAAELAHTNGGPPVGPAPTPSPRPRRRAAAPPPPAGQPDESGHPVVAASMDREE